MQLDNYQIIPNTPELDLKTGRTTSTTKGREEAISKKVESIERQFERQMDHGHCSGKGSHGSGEGRKTN